MSLPLAHQAETPRAQPLRVLLLVQSGGGGMVHYAASLSAALHKLVDLKVVVIGHDARRFFPAVVEVISLETGSRNPTAIWRQASRVRAELDAWSPHVVHITNPSHLNILNHKTLGHYPIVSTIHDVELHKGERTLTSRLIHAYHLRTPGQLIVHGVRSQRMLQALRRSSGNVHVIPHGNYTRLSSVPTPPTGHERDVLFFGRILDYKGLEFFVEAVNKVRRVNPSIRGVIAGRGDIARAVSRMEDAQGFYVRNEHIPEDELRQLFVDSFVVVCPYVEASQSGVIALSFAFGRPVVATDVGDLPDVVKNHQNGFVVPPRDSDAIAERILLLDQNRELVARLGVQAQYFSDHNLSWKPIAQRTVEVYKQALEEERTK